MNKDVLEGKWKQLRGKVKTTWGKLTDDDLDKIAGRADMLAGVLQEKYGYAKDRAEAEIKRLFDDVDVSTTSGKSGSRTVPALLAGMLLAGMSLAGCARSEPTLTAKVKSKLMADSTVKAYQINVDSREDVVTLTGSVDTQVEKEQAIRLARDTKGVRDVVDMISVRTSAGNGDAPEPNRTVGEVVDDAGITMAVKGKLLDDPDVKGLKIDVDTREGVVYLTGSVKTSAEKAKAIQLARDTKNVRNVVSNLTIEQS